MNIISSDLVLEKINAGWNDAIITKEYKSLAKWLRLLVNHVKTPEGVPKEFVTQVRDWANHLTDSLSDMEEGEACQCVSSIDHANRKCGAYEVYGAGLKAKLSPDERRRISRSNRPFKLRAKGIVPKESAIPGGNDDV